MYKHTKRRSTAAKLVAVAAAVLLIAAGCSGDDEDDAGPIRIAIVAPSAENDLAFTQSMVDAVAAVGEGREIEVAVTDGTFIVEEAAAAIRGYAEDGYDLVIAHGSQYGGPLEEIAQDFEDTSFAWGTAVDFMGLDNVFAYTVRSDEGGYVAGTVAAQISQTGVIGVIGPVPVGDAKLYVDGFAAGVAATDPSVTTNIVYTDSFSDVALAAEAAEAHISNDADVLTGSAQMVVGATGVAKENGVAWFGTQANQTALGEDIVVASQVYHWEVLLDSMIDKIEAGILGGEVMTATLANGGIEIEFNDGYGLDAAIQEAAEATIDGIVDGSISTGQ
ncbi:BMP family protein [Candidatus Poriferisodalis sp.]|uniref:BMP family protein n=1 Tax=Candidatus Poriferisodalis sp. TaxID=3101277 RepID=UPI003B51BE09